MAGSTLNNVTLSGNYQLTGNSLIYIQNDLTVDGTLTLGNSDLYGILYFVSGASQTLDGSGTVVFGGTSLEDSLALSIGTLTIGSGITVQGQTGYVGFSPEIGGSPNNFTVVNQGTIQADVSGGTIYVEDASTTNTGTLNATNGGTLSLQSANFTPGGVIEADAGSTITIGGTIDNTGLVFSPTGTGTVAITGTVDGGTVDAGTGTNLVLAGSTLNNVTLSGNYQLTGNSLIYIQNDLTVDGTLTLGNSDLYGILYFVSGASQTLDGSGTVVFGGTSLEDSLALSIGTLTIGSGITVQGQTGYVGFSPEIGGSPNNFTVVNQGTIQADVSGGTIYVEDASITNTGTLNATNGDTLSLQSANFTPGGVIEADAGSTITIGGTIDNTGLVFSPTGTGTIAITGTVDGGTVDAGTGTNLVLAGSTLNNVTLSGNYQLTGNSLIYIQNDLTVDGTLTLGNSDLYGILYFVSGASQTLDGSGTVVFGGTSLEDSLALSIGTLTIGSGITVQGQTGYVGFSPEIGGSPNNFTVVNQGTIQADVSGGTIYVEDASTTNTGTLNATNGDTLSLQSANFTPGGVIEADAGSTITIGGTIDNTGLVFSPTGTGTVAITGTIDGGTVDAGTGTNLVLAGSTLNNVTLSGNYQLTGNSLIYIQNDLTVDGTLTLGNSDLYGILYFVSGASQTLDGSGTVVFGGTSLEDSLALSIGTLTIGSGITVQGQTGYVGFSPEIGGSPNNFTVVNQGTIQADVSGGTIYVEDASTTNTGTLNATNGDTLSLQSANFTPGGVIEADAGSTITIGGTIDNTGLVFSPTGTGTVAITGTIDGGTVDAGTGTNLVLAGSTLNNVTLSGNYQLTGNSFIYIQNNLTLDGTLTLGDGSSYGVLYFESETSQTLGGSGTVVFSGTSSGDSLTAYIETLTIGAGITVQGQNGYVGYDPNFGGSPDVSVVNQGTIAADTSGGTITVYGTGNLQNVGILQALNGGTLSLQGGNWQDSGVNYVDATTCFPSAHCSRTPATPSP